MKAKIFEKEDWCFWNYKNTKLFQGITREEYEIAREKRFARMIEATHVPDENRVQKARKTLEYFSKIPYVYEGDGWDDYNRYQRPCSNGVGYVAICPGERANTVYVDDPFVVAALTRKYNEWKSKNAGR